MAEDRLNHLYQTATELYHAGDLAGAEKQARRVAKKVPKNANALNLLAVIVQQQGKIDEAIKLFSRVCALAPDQLQAHINLGNALREAGQHPEARRAYETALEHDPNFVAAKINLGTTLQESGDFKQALDHFSGATEIAPDYQPAHYNRGVCLRDMRRFDDALAALTRAIELNPADPGSYLERANVLSDMGRDDDAIIDIQTALRLRPNWPDAYGNWGSFLTNLDRHEEALEKFDKSLVLDPNNVTNVVNRGLACLAMGNLEQGWPAYLRRAESAAPFYAKFEHDLPEWAGQDICDQHVLVWTEQALGDQILYAGLMEEFAQLAGRVTWICPAKVSGLFRSAFAGLKNVEVTDQDLNDLPLGDYDFQASMIDLAAALRPSMSAFPAPAPYLRPDKNAARGLRKALHQRFGPETKLVGLSWASKNPLIGDGKTLDFDSLQPLLSLAGVQFINVQYGPAGEDFSGLPEDLRAKIWTVEDVDLNGLLEDSLNLLAALDLFITCSNTTAHLSSAAGLPTWILVPAGKARIWYWFLEGTQSPWYLKARLFRRQHRESWAATVGQVTRELESYLISDT